MRLLADTQILLWQFADDPRLTGKLRSSLTDDASEIVVSDVSLWEVVIKNRTGKLKIDVAAFEREIDRQDYARIPIAREHIRQLAHVPLIHRDPFDHLLIAQAQAEDLRILTADEKFSAYRVKLAVE